MARETLKEQSQGITSGRTKIHLDHLLNYKGLRLMDLVRRKYFPINPTYYAYLLKIP